MNLVQDLFFSDLFKTKDQRLEEVCKDKDVKRFILLCEKFLKHKKLPEKENKDFQDLLEDPKIIKYLELTLKTHPDVIKAMNLMGTSIGLYFGAFPTAIFTVGSFGSLSIGPIILAAVAGGILGKVILSPILLKINEMHRAKLKSRDLLAKSQGTDLISKSIETGGYV